MPPSWLDYKLGPVDGLDLIEWSRPSAKSAPTQPTASMGGPIMIDIHPALKSRVGSPSLTNGTQTPKKGWQLIVRTTWDTPWKHKLISHASFLK